MIVVQKKWIFIIFCRLLLIFVDFYSKNMHGDDSAVDWFVAEFIIIIYTELISFIKYLILFSIKSVDFYNIL